MESENFVKCLEELYGKGLDWNRTDRDKRNENEEKQ